MDEDMIRDIVRDELRREMDMRTATRAKMIDDVLLRLPMSRFTGNSYDTYFAEIVKELSRVLGLA